METCEYHTQLVADIAVIKTDITYIKDKVCSHISEGEEKGGFRDRLIIAEQQIAAMRSSVWKIGVTAGFIGALLGNLTPEAIILLSKWITGH